MSTNNYPVHGKYGVWSFQINGVRDLVKYVVTVPGCFDPIDDVVPYLISLSKIPRGLSIPEFAQLHVDGLYRPGMRNNPALDNGHRLRFASVSEYKTYAAATKNKYVPPCDPLNRFDAMMWVSWFNVFQSGPFHVRVKNSDASRSVPCEAGHIWDVIDDGTSVKIGYKEYDEHGNVQLWTQVEPTDPEDLLDKIASRRRLDALAGL